MISLPTNEGFTRGERPIETGMAPTSVMRPPLDAMQSQAVPVSQSP